MVGTIIGLMGAKRSGKDTVADYLADAYGFTRVAFADPLKEALLALDPYIEEPLGWTRLSQLVKPEGSIRDRFEPIKDYPDVRGLLQRYGVLIRELKEDFWVDVALDKIRDLWEESLNDHEPIPGFVIPDVRFPNEYLSVLDECSYGFVVKVERTGLLHDDAHISETALTDWEPSAIVDNGGSLADLYREVDRVLEALAASELLEPFKKIREIS